MLAEDGYCSLAVGVVAPLSPAARKFDFFFPPLFLKGNISLLPPSAHPATAVLYLARPFSLSLGFSSAPREDTRHTSSPECQRAVFLCPTMACVARPAISIFPN